MDTTLSKLFMPIYIHLYKKHLVFEDGKVYVTKVIMNPVHMVFDVTDDY